MGRTVNDETKAVVNSLKEALLEIKVEHSNRLNLHEERINGHGRSITALETQVTTQNELRKEVTQKLTAIDGRLRDVEVRVYAAVVLVSVAWALINKYF